MKNNFVLIGEEPNSFLIDFLEKQQVFFIKYDKNKNYKNERVFFFSFNINENVAKNEIAKINKLDKEISIILPHHLKDCFVNEAHKKICYPIKLSVFKGLIKTIFNKKQSFGDLIVRGNYIENTNSKIRTHLTETQINIFKIIISGNRVEKDKIKKDILKIANSLDTKSLESHLSRIRKKLIEIESKTTLISADTGHIKLIVPRVDH